jgi:oxygen-independent coproporphyrinogen-3 oxidase
MQLVKLPPLSLYVHIPWCLRKCPYCDFNSHERKGDLPECGVRRRVAGRRRGGRAQVYGRRLSTVFIGGGTPSLFTAESIDAC